jgi:hypothetical protein
VLLALAACQPALLPALQSESKLPHAEARQTSLGTVNLKIDGLPQALPAPKGLKTATAPDLNQIRSIRLTAKGPGMTAVSTTVPWPVPSGQTLNLRVPIGKNRLITFEALDADGYPIVTLRSPIANVTTAPQEVAVDINSDVAGRTLDLLLAKQGMQAGVSDILAVADLVPRLQTYYDRITGYDAATNTYRFVPPRTVRSGELVRRMLNDSWQILGAINLPGDMFIPAGAAVPVKVMDPQGNPIAGAQVTALDPNSAAATTDANGQATLLGVPPGTWAIRATKGTLIATNTVTTLDQETTTAVPLSLRPPRPETPTVTGTSLSDELRVLITGTEDPQVSAGQLTAMAERLVEEAPSEADAMARMNAAFAATITTEADVTKLAEQENALDGFTIDSTQTAVDRFQTQGFRTQTTVAPGCDTTRPKTTLLYVNDHLSTYLDFLQTYAVLFHRLRGSQVIPDVKVLAHFNACGAEPATRKDNLAALDGAGLFPWLRSTIWGSRAGAFPLNGGPNGVPFVEGLMREPTTPGFQRQIERFTNLIETEIMSGNALVLMPHGQGNNLVKRSLEQIRTKAEAGTYGSQSANVKHAIATIALGSPIDPAVSNFSTNQNEVAVDKDFVTVRQPHMANNNMRACATPARAVLASCAAEAGGRDTVPSPVESDKALEHHDCVKSYLQGQPWEKIRTTLQQLELQHPFQVAGSGTLQFQLRWETVGDVDMYIKEPSGNVVYFNRKTGTHGALDVDNILSYGPENYYVCQPDQLHPGDEFEFGVNFYRMRNNVDPVPYSLWIKAGSSNKTYTGTVSGQNFGLTIIGLGRVRIGSDPRTRALTYDILDGGANIPMQVSIPPGFSVPVP